MEWMPSCNPLLCWNSGGESFWSRRHRRQEWHKYATAVTQQWNSRHTAVTQQAHSSDTAVKQQAHSRDGAVTQVCHSSDTAVTRHWHSWDTGLMIFNTCHVKKDLLIFFIDGPRYIRYLPCYRLLFLSTMLQLYVLANVRLKKTLKSSYISFEVSKHSKTRD